MTRPRLSVLIPTHGRPRQLAACLERLARQNLAADQYEVLVGVDGPDEGSERAARAAWGSCAAALHVHSCPRAGYNPTRNTLLPLARGELLVSLNDDVLPEAGFLRAHVEAHERAGRGVMVTGYSPFRRWDHPTLLDRLVGETSMVFFYDRMEAEPEDEGRDWGYRHCWGLNFSVPLAMVREVGPFTAFELQYGYDDIEMAWRVRRRYGCPVLFCRRARADHDHRYGAAELLERERRLGRSAWHFAGACPDFCRDLFGREIRSEAEVSYCRQFVERERATARRLRDSFLALESIPAGAVDGPHAANLVNLLYEQHLLLKRWYWRAGLLEGAGHEAPLTP